jgi:hypothetical protein
MSELSRRSVLPKNQRHQTIQEDEEGEDEEEED